MQQEMLSILLLCSLLSACLSDVCSGTTGLSSTETCATTSLAECEHNYVVSSTEVRNCRRVGSACYTLLYSCTPKCNGTISTTSCASIPRTLCHRYYQTDATGSYYCQHNPVLDKCETRSPKLYCATGYAVPCGNGGIISPDSCTMYTSESTCTSHYQVEPHGQRNKCEWDAAYNSCYVGVACSLGF